jgi:hypothetical protein
MNESNLVPSIISHQLRSQLQAIVDITIITITTTPATCSFNYYRIPFTMRRNLHTAARRASVFRAGPEAFLRQSCGLPTTSRPNLAAAPASHQHLAWQHSHSNRFSSSSTKEIPDLSYIQRHYRVHRRGQEGHGSREYLLLPPHVRSVDQVQLDPSLPAAALWAHRNILFGARCFLKECSLVDICGPLVQTAVQEAEEYGEQPQGMATLKGLCPWVA